MTLRLSACLSLSRPRSLRNGGALFSTRQAIETYSTFQRFKQRFPQMFGSAGVKLAQVMEGVPVISAIPDSVAAAEVRGLAYDSRKAAPGFLFFAFPGSKTDGRQFAAQAIEKGAVAVISEAAAPPRTSLALDPCRARPSGSGDRLPAISITTPTVA